MHYHTINKLLRTLRMSEREMESIVEHEKFQEEYELAWLHAKQALRLISMMRTEIMGKPYDS